MTLGDIHLLRGIKFGIFDPLPLFVEKCGKVLYPRLSTWNTWHLNVHCARNRFALRGGACSASLPEVKFDYRKKLLHFTTRSGMIPYQQRNQFRFDSRSGTCFALLKQAGLRFADAELARIHCWKRLCVAIQSGTCVSNKAVNFGVFTNQNKFKFIF